MATLYITEQGAILTKTDGRLLIRKGHKILQDLPAVHVDRIVLFGNVHLTTPAVTFALKEGIDVVFLSSHGTYRGRLQSGWAKDAKLRKLQYQAFLAPDRRLSLAKRFVIGKLHNMLALCRRQEKRKEVDLITNNIKQMARITQKAMEASDLPTLRGYEGAATSLFYKLFGVFLKQELNFRGRNKRPPRDPINALLSLGYTLLYNSLFSSINIVGLDPYLGFFHEIKRGHAALVSDLMEEWRPIIVDSLVLNVINHGELQREDFHINPDSVLLTKRGLKHFLQRYDNRLETRIRHPRLRQRVTYRQCIALQVRNLSDALTNPAKTYQPFLAR